MPQPVCYWGRAVEVRHLHQLQVCILPCIPTLACPFLVCPHPADKGQQCVLLLTFRVLLLTLAVVHPHVLICWLSSALQARASSVCSASWSGSSTRAWPAATAPPAWALRLRRPLPAQTHIASPDVCWRLVSADSLLRRGSVASVEPRCTNASLEQQRAEVCCCWPYACPFCKVQLAGSPCPQMRRPLQTIKLALDKLRLCKTIETGNQNASSFKRAAICQGPLAMQLLGMLGWSGFAIHCHVYHGCPQTSAVTVQLGWLLRCCTHSSPRLQLAPPALRLGAGSRMSTRHGAR